VIGAFGDWDCGRLRGTSNFPGAVGQENNSSAWFAGGRVGYVVTPRFLTYTDGGWTQARFDGVNYNFAIAGGGPTGLSLAAKTYNGWFLGSGLNIRSIGCRSPAYSSRPNIAIRSTGATTARACR
jgi:hypothetical protein